MKKQFVLGQEVVIKGRYVINPVSHTEVDEVEARIKVTGQPEASEKYRVESFEVEKHGIITGIRSIVGSRIHYLDHNGQVVTKTTRQPAYLVATDMRGLCYVPVDMVTVAEEPETEIAKLKQENGFLKWSNGFLSEYLSEVRQELAEYKEIDEDDDDLDFDDDDLDYELDELEDELVNA
ncbi:hypothetical protein J2Z23_000189 [Lederbergia galactosidilyticus]|uniref:hypothetical protein n=1 Tax=Lederbergia galactosidilytica TaxID=217031 RepID=UPI001AE927DF|nr:hypothetical protein [Lederbergia galactosidilytica]MBP1913257.1 hypothetical protein [Lederbergia galactosidilytica]